MSNPKIDTTIGKIFRQKLSELKIGGQVGTEFYLFFADDFWLYKENSLIGREGNYAVVSMLIEEFKPSHYALVADTNVRDPHTNNIMYEQLMACIVSADGKHKTFFQPYDRLHNGKIKLSRPRTSMDGLQMTGIGVSLFEPPTGLVSDPEAKAQFLQFFSSVIAAEKVPYLEDAAPSPTKH